MRTKLFIVVSLVMVVSMVLAACAPAAPGETTVVTQVVTVEVPVEGAPGETIIVTATPEPEVPMEFKSADPTTFVHVTFGEPETLDPALLYETAGGAVLFNVYNSLIFYNRENPTEFVAELATEVPSLENGGISEDGLTYTFNIRQGVTFHDGSPMTPSDVAYSFQRNMLQGGTSSPQWLLTEPILGAGIADVTDVIDSALNDDPEALAAVDPAVLLETCQKVVDAFVADDAAGTVTMKLAQPWGPFLGTLANTWGSVSSKAWVMSKGGWDGDCATWQNYYGKSSEQVNELGLGTEAMGTGPFMLDHWTQGEEYVLKANESYWRTEPAWEGGPTGAPALKTVIVKSVDEFSTRFAMLQAGDADSIQVGASSDWPQMDTLVGESCEGKLAENCQPEAENPEGSITRIKGLQQTARTDIFFTFNINAEGNTFIGSGVVDGNGIPPDFFSDIHIRKAFAYCFNYEAYFNDVMLGEAVRSKNVIIPGMLGYDDASPFYEQDMAKCEEEFKASTWTAADGTSLWDTGFRMTIGYNTGNTARQTAAQIFQTEIGALNENFIVEFTGLPWPTFLRNQRASNLPIFISGWQEDIHDPHNWVQPYTTGTYGGRQALPEEIKAQFADINTRAVTESDPAKRDEIYKTEFNPLIYETVSVIPMYVSLTRRYQQRWVKGWFYNDIFPGTYYYPISKQ